jgi:hypothetical protein
MTTIELVLRPSDGAKIGRAAIGTYAWLLWLGGAAVEGDLAEWAGCSWQALRRDLHELSIAGLVKYDRKQYGGDGERVVEIIKGRAA